MTNKLLIIILMTSNALVPFKLSNNFHDPLRCEERLIDINGKYIRIKQSWKSDGKGGTEIGFGASVYNCSIVLAHYLQENIQIVKDKVVLELGCGTGFLSIALKILGATFVICTDGDILSVNIAKENIERNFKDEIELQTIKAHKLYWGDLSDETHIFEMVKSFRKTRRISSNINHLHTTAILPSSSIEKTNTNTNNNNTNNSFTYSSSSNSSVPDGCIGYDDVNNSSIVSQYPDLIVGADIAALPYSSAYIDLINTLRRNCSKQTIILLCYQCRHYSENKFFDLLKEHFAVEM